MSIRFSKPDGRTHDSELCDHNLNLLAHAQLIELDLGSECGGHGICGKDRVKLPPDAGPGEPIVSAVTEEERHHLTEAELLQGWRLACQCWPEKDGCSLTVGCKY
jgi:ferredoxin